MSTNNNNENTKRSRAEMLSELPNIQESISTASTKTNNAQRKNNVVEFPQQATQQAQRSQQQRNAQQNVVSAQRVNQNGAAKRQQNVASINNKTAQQSAARPAQKPVQQPVQQPAQQSTQQTRKPANQRALRQQQQNASADRETNVNVQKTNANKARSNRNDERRVSNVERGSLRQNEVIDDYEEEEIEYEYVPISEASEGFIAAAVNLVKEHFVVVLILVLILIFVIIYLLNQHVNSVFIALSFGLIAFAMCAILALSWQNKKKAEAEYKRAASVMSDVREMLREEGIEEESEEDKEILEAAEADKESIKSNEKDKE